MNRFKLILATMVAGGLLTACTQSQTGPPNISSVNPLAISKVQMAVGTANFDGFGVGLNVVSTMRQANGDSAVLVDTPSLTGPFTFDEELSGVAPGSPGEAAYSTAYGDPNAVATPIPPGPSLSEASAGDVISGTTQFMLAGAPECDTTLAPPYPEYTSCPAGISPDTTTFGQAGGVFGMGIAPYNNTINGTAYSYAPYNAPLYDTLNLAFTPWGGPPAFDPNGDGMGYRDGLFNIAQILGMGMGITPFENVSPDTGTYTMSVVVPTSPTAHGTLTTSATLSSLVPLGVPTLGNAVLDGSGGGTFTITLPGGVTEAYVEIIDFGNLGSTNCQGATGPNAGLPVYYTIEITASGNAVLPDMDGPNTNVGGGKGHLVPSPSICTPAQNLAAGGTDTNDTVQLQIIGMDYPLFEASYPTNRQQTPTLVGTAGQADITFSAIYTNGSSGGIKPRSRWSLFKHIIHIHPRLEVRHPGAEVGHKLV